MIAGIYGNAVQQPHLLIAGTTGSGKSTVIQALLYTIVCAESIPDSELWLLDPKKVELYPWRNSPYCTNYADEQKDMCALLQKACRVMDNRYRTMRAKGELMSSEKPIYIVIDELADLMLSTNRVSAADINIAISRLAQLGRAAKIHLIVATQFVRRSVLPESLIANITSVIGLRTRDSVESRMIIGQQGCENLPRYGKCLYITPDLVKPIIQNLPMIEKEELEEARKSLYKKKA